MVLDNIPLLFQLSRNIVIVNVRSKAVIVIYYTSGLNQCLTSDALNSATGEAAS
jgi:hypothetical protein